MKKSVIVICILCSVLSCNRQKNANNGNASEQPASAAVPEEVAAQEDFSDFITRFHADAEFLYSRLADNVAGFNSDDYDIDTETPEAYVWKHADIAYYMLSDVDALFEGEAVVRYDMDDSFTVHETAEIPDSSCFIVGTYKKDQGKWYMTELTVNLL